MSSPVQDHRDDYVDFCHRLRRLAGIDLRQYKRQQMERRLRAHIERRGASTLAEYAAIIAKDPAELTVLLDRLTINVSQLFRNPEQWDLVHDRLLPEVSRRGPVRAWSAGCSYGAEAYSLAALMCEAGIQGKILASDIDAGVLEAAGRGHFSEYDARSAPSDMMQRWFHRDEDGGWVANESLRSMVHVQRENLLELPHRPSSFDLIMCRNVVIYFTAAAREQVHASLAYSLKPGGYLVVGSTERITQDLASLRLVAVQPFIYKKA